MQNLQFILCIIVLPSLVLLILWQASTSKLSKSTFIEFRIPTTVFCNSLPDMLVGIPPFSNLFLPLYCCSVLFLVPTWTTFWVRIKHIAITKCDIFFYYSDTIEILFYCFYDTKLCAKLEKTEVNSFYIVEIMFVR